MKISEDSLCASFADTMVASVAFRRWVLERTKFADFAEGASLLKEELEKRRSKAWWRHWWTKVHAVGRESETDILLLFRSDVDGTRFALHVEMKVDAPLTVHQAGDYALRAQQMASDKRLMYSDFETVIVAPKAYLERNSVECGKFDVRLPFEDVSTHVPEFGVVASTAGTSTAPNVCSAYGTVF